MTSYRSLQSCKSMVPVNEAQKVALMHMRPIKDNTESSRDFVVNSRNILMKEISIQDKKVLNQLFCLN